MLWSIFITYIITHHGLGGFSGLINGLIAAAIGALSMLMSEPTAKKLCKEDMYVCPLNRNIYIYIYITFLYLCCLLWFDSSILSIEVHCSVCCLQIRLSCSIQKLQQNFHLETELDAKKLRMFAPFIQRSQMFGQSPVCLEM